MTETAATIGYGSSFEISLNGGSTWTEVAEPTEITTPSDNLSIHDATNFASPDATMEYIIGMNDPGEAGFTMNFVAGGTGDALVQQVRAARARIMCRITFPNAVIWTFSAILTGYQPELPVDGVMTAAVTLKVTASYSVTAAAVPANTVLPAVSGIAQVGETLTALEGQWSGAPSFTYQWQEDDSGWANITGATGRTYVPVVGLVGNPLRVIVTAQNSEGSASATSAPTAAVLAE